MDDLRSWDTQEVSIEGEDGTAEDGIIYICACGCSEFMVGHVRATDKMFLSCSKCGEFRYPSNFQPQDN
jgi:hypothetical protein